MLRMIEFIEKSKRGSTGKLCQFNGEVFPPFDTMNITGAIPESLGQLSSLEELFLHCNRLTGEIPRSLGNLRNLRKLLLNSNDLVGPIPPELGWLSSLDTMDLSWNNLRGEVPAGVRALVS